MEMAYIKPGTFKYHGYTVIWNHHLVYESPEDPEPKIDFSYTISGSDLPFVIYNTASVDFNNSKELETENEIYDSVPVSELSHPIKKHLQECIFMLQTLEVAPGTFCAGEYTFSWNILGDSTVMTYHESA